MTRTKLIGARDANGIRPLVLGDLDGKPIFASETCALDIIGAKFVRDVENGEVVICEIQPDGSHHHRFVQAVPADAASASACSNTSTSPGPIRSSPAAASIAARKRMGINLAARSAGRSRRRRAGARWRHARRRSATRRQSGIPFELGIIRNHYVGRTFIEPTQSIRAFGVKLKHSANRAEIEGKRVVLVDDSIVRGTTSVKIVQMIRDAGAREVHIRVASPMIYHSDYYGIDTPDPDKLLANQHRRPRLHVPLSSAPICLQFLSIDGLYDAVGGEAATTCGAAVHRPLLHRRLPHRPHRPQRPRPGGPKTLSLMREAS